MSTLTDTSQADTISVWGLVHDFQINIRSEHHLGGEAVVMVQWSRMYAELVKLCSAIDWNFEELNLVICFYAVLNGVTEVGNYLANYILIIY